MDTRKVALQGVGSSSRTSVALQGLWPHWTETPVEIERRDRRIPARMPNQFIVNPRFRTNA